jgi:hypothetical protein
MKGKKILTWINYAYIFFCYYDKYIHVHPSKWYINNNTSPTSWKQLYYCT